LPKQLLVVLEARDAPCIFVIVVVPKKKAVGEEIPPGPVFSRHGRIREGREREK
jgi:hypothetical protein